MNKQELELARWKNLNKLDVFAFRPKINAVEINVGNSINHELTKFLCVWLIRNGVPVYELETFLKKPQIIPERIIERGIGLIGELMDNVQDITDLYGQKYKHEWERPNVVTESIMKDKIGRASCRERV